jgi:hypothetical protein
VQLKRIGFQSARVADNPNFDFMSESIRDLMQKKGIHLLTAIINFFTSALHYFSKGFAGTSSPSGQQISGHIRDTLVEGGKYNDGKSMLELAIEEYDQAVIDVTTSIVGSRQLRYGFLTKAFILMRYYFEVKKKMRNSWNGYRPGQNRHTGLLKLNYIRRESREQKTRCDGLETWRSFAFGTQLILNTSQKKMFCGLEALPALANLLNIDRDLFHRVH